mmetsp:Transcript_19192/g.31020  ORF Transcript_19192/g.31020 Transcript_19192/m.31020 type:complete len:82 (+) Transcript_19192:646-891(+)
MRAAVTERFAWQQKTDICLYWSGSMSINQTTLAQVPWMGQLPVVISVRWSGFMQIARKAAPQLPWTWLRGLASCHWWSGCT